MLDARDDLGTAAYETDNLQIELLPCENNAFRGNCIENKREHVKAKLLSPFKIGGKISGIEV